MKTLSLDTRSKTSMGGFQVLSDYSLEDFPQNFSLLILAGGDAWLEQKNSAVLPVVDYAVKKHIPVGAICNAANFMAENGYLDQIRHSGNTLEFMKLKAPHYMGEKNFIEQQAVSDANIITANGSAALEFAREILLLLKAKPENTISEWYKLHKSGFYSN